MHSRTSAIRARQIWPGEILIYKMQKGRRGCVCLLACLMRTCRLLNYRLSTQRWEICSFLVSARKERKEAAIGGGFLQSRPLLNRQAKRNNYMTRKCPDFRSAVSQSTCLRNKNRDIFAVRVPKLSCSAVMAMRPGWVHRVVLRAANQK